MNEFCSRHSKAIMALLNLQSHGVTEEQIYYMRTASSKGSCKNLIDAE